MSEIVTGLVIAIVAEFHAKTVEWTIVETAKEALHDIAGFEVETLESGEKLRVEAGGEGLGCGGHGF
jgi:hypothetical protein